MSYGQTKEYQKAYALAHAEKKREIAKAHYYANKEKKLAYQKEYQSLNKEQRKEYLEKTKAERLKATKEYYQSNKVKLISYSRDWREKNPEYHKEWYEKYYADNKVKIVRNAIRNTMMRLSKDEQFKIIFNLRSRIRTAFRHYSETGKVFSSKEYGIDYKKIFERLGPCPGPREDYHIDHIMPLHLFNLNRSEDVKDAFAPSNHRWMLGKDNLSKSSKCVLYYL